MTLPDRLPEDDRPIPKTDPTQPMRFRVAEVCRCGTVLRINVVATRRQTRQAVDRFRTKHTGLGHGPGELLIDKRKV